MKEKNIFRLLLLLLLASSLWACNKEEPIKPALPIDYTVLPAATQEGKNTFGCKVNGQVWVPRVEISAPWFDKMAQLHEKNGTGDGGISSRVLSTTQDESMSFGFGPTFFKAVTCFGNEINLPKCGANFNATDGAWYSNDTKDSLSNWIKISAIDTVKNFVSGTFEFTLVSDQDKNRKVKITEGRFDMPYFPQ